MMSIFQETSSVGDELSEERIVTLVSRNISVDVEDELQPEQVQDDSQTENVHIDSRPPSVETVMQKTIDIHADLNQEKTNIDKSVNMTEMTDCLNSSAEDEKLGESSTLGSLIEQGLSSKSKLFLKTEEGAEQIQDLDKHSDLKYALKDAITDAIDGEELDADAVSVCQKARISAAVKIEPKDEVKIHFKYHPYFRCLG